MPDAAKQELSGDALQVRGHLPSEWGGACGQGASTKFSPRFDSFLPAIIQGCHVPTPIPLVFSRYRFQPAHCTDPDGPRQPAL